MPKKAKKAKPKVHIEPKPTVYRGVKFRSRLEARWAVYFEFNPVIDFWKYEPKTLRLPERGWDYCPDFVIQYGSGFQSYVEVKPEIPTDSYLEILSEFIPKLSGCVGHSLFLFLGDFFNQVPKVFAMTPGIVPTMEQIKTHQDKLSKVPLLHHAEALKVASQYRFDLPEARPQFRQGNMKQTPFDYWREWQEKEAKANRKSK